MKFTAAYIATALAFVVIDVIWLTMIARSFYREMIGPLLKEDPNLVAAAVFYVCYVGAIVWFAVLPALEQDSLRTAALNGLILGLICYATYDLTNLATLEGFPAKMAVVDILWGGALTLGSATLGYLGARLVL